MSADDQKIITLSLATATIEDSQPESQLVLVEDFFTELRVRLGS